MSVAAYKPYPSPSAVTSKGQILPASPWVGSWQAVNRREKRRLKAGERLLPTAPQSSSTTVAASTLPRWHLGPKCPIHQQLFTRCLSWRQEHHLHSRAWCPAHISGTSDKAGFVGYAVAMADAAVSSSAGVAQPASIVFAVFPCPWQLPAWGRGDGCNCFYFGSSQLCHLWLSP